MYKSIEKLRRAPHPVRQRLTAVITIVAVAIITVVWFGFFVWSLIVNKSGTADVPRTNTAAVVGSNSIQPPFGQ